jgi:acyl-CoA synthetase (AMP-forming)/AMP-acid ligase II
MQATPSPTHNVPLAAVADATAPARLAAALESVAAVDPHRVAVVAAAGGEHRRVVTYGDLAASLADLERRLDAERPVGIVARAGRLEALVAVVAACGRQHVPLALVAEDSRDLVGELRDWIVIGTDLLLPEAPPGGRPRREYGSVPPQVVVATSGTSGPPKLVEHSWDSLLASARLAEQWHGRGWLLVYDSTRWAGTQVWLQALLTGGRVVVPESRDPDAVARAVTTEEVSILPATPTLLRRVIASADREVVSRMQLDRITLGGEMADGQLLDQACAMFPAAKVTHVYATTELGEVFRVTDGRPGFPAEWIGRALPGGARLSTRRDGELHVQLSRDTAEVATGDLVERRGDRYEFTGRRSDVIVVGGAKVYPRRVEEVLRAVPGVADARVYGMPSAITGEIVAAQIVPTEPLPGNATPEAVRAAALAACRGALEAHSVPRVLDFTRKLYTNPSGKVSRRPVGT